MVKGYCPKCKPYVEKQKGNKGKKSKKKDD